MGKFADAALRKPKHAHSKKDTLEEKKKLADKSKTPSPKHEALLEPEATTTEPVAPKKSRAHEKKGSQKKKGVVIREVVSEARDSPLILPGSGPSK